MGDKRRHAVSGKDEGVVVSRGERREKKRGKTKREPRLLKLRWLSSYFVARLSALGACDVTD